MIMSWSNNPQPLSFSDRKRRRFPTVSTRLVSQINSYLYQPMYFNSFFSKLMLILIQQLNHQQSALEVRCITYSRNGLPLKSRSLCLSTNIPLRFARPIRAPCLKLFESANNPILPNSTSLKRKSSLGRDCQNSDESTNSPSINLGEQKGIKKSSGIVIE